MAAKFNPTTYAKNVLRSAGYIGVESIKGVNPTLTDLIMDTGGVAKDAYESTKEFIKNPKSILKGFIGEEAVNSMGDLKHNILDDIRTGKFYNPDRANSDMNAAWSEELGFNFDDLDLDVDEDFGEDKKKNVSVDTGSTRAINNLSITNQRLFTASTDSITSNNTRNTTRTITQNAKMVGMLNGSLISINSSILSLHNDVAKPLNAHIVNSTNFYKTATELMAKQTSYLENINKLLTEYTTRGAKNKKQGKTTSWDEVMAGGFSPSGFANVVKKNFFDQTMLSTFKDFLSPDMMETMRMGGVLSSPISLIATMALQNYLQESPLGAALERTSGIIQGGITNGFQRIHNYRKSNKIKTWDSKKGGFVNKNKNPILGFLADLFDIVPDKGLKGSIKNNLKPDKGPTQWTGLNDKALREVIPTQLATIISLISGQEPKLYNYNTGRWQTASSIVSNFKKQRKENAAKAGDELGYDVTKEWIADRNKNGEKYGFNSRAVRNLRDDYNTLISLLSTSGVSPASIDYSTLRKLSAKWVRLGLISQESINTFGRYLFRGTNLTRLKTTMLNAQTADANFLNNGEYDSTFNNVVSAGMAGTNTKKRLESRGSILGKDDKGNDIYFYLQQYYTQLDYIVHNIETGGIGGSYKSNKKNKRSAVESFNNYSKNKLASIDNRTSEQKSDEEKQKTAAEKTIANKEKNERSSNHRFDVYNDKDKRYHRTGSLDTYDVDFEKDNTDAISNMWDSVVNDNLSKLLFGVNPTRDDRNYGLLKPIKDLTERATEFFNDIRKTISDWWKQKWNDFKQWEPVKKFREGFFRTYTNAAKSAKNTVETQARVSWNRLTGKNTDKVISDAASAIANDMGSAAYGGQVRKSGMVSVSEGEMIIPSEYNPYYHGTTNKYTQKFNEKRNYNNWVKTGGRSRLPYWGSYAEGTESVNEPINENDITSMITSLVEQHISSNEIVRIVNDHLSKKSGKKKDYTARIKEIIAGVQDNAQRYGKEIKKDVSGVEETALAKTAKMASDRLFENIKTPFQMWLGGLKKNTKDTGNEVLKVLKDKFPETMATGSMGALVGGALTGSGIGLLGGFVVGAGVNILKESKMASKFLFGEYDKENDEYSGGVLPKKMVNFIRKKAPNIAKSAALGGILGAIGLAPGGIMGGLIAGTTIQILYDVKTIRGTVQTLLFGEEGVDGQRRGGIIGSLQTRVVDPIADYVQNGLKNFDTYLKDNFLNPLLKIFRPMSDWIAGKGIKVLEGVGGALKRAAEDTFGSLGRSFDQTIGRVLGFGVDQIPNVAKLAGNIASAPFKAVGKLGDKWEIHNINAGFSTRSAQERVELTKGKTSDYNKKLAALQSEGKTAEANKLIFDTDKFARGKDGAKSDLEKHKRETKNKIVSSLVSGGVGNEGMKLGNNIERIMKGEKANNGDFSEILAYINTLKPSEMTDANKKLVSDLLANETNYVKDQQRDIDNYDANRQIFFKDIYGIDLAQVTKGLKGKKAEQAIQKVFKPFKDQAYVDKRHLAKEVTDNFQSEADKENKLEKLRLEDPLAGDNNTQLRGISGWLEKIAKYIENRFGKKPETKNAELSPEEAKKKAQELADQHKAKLHELAQQNNSKANDPAINAIDTKFDSGLDQDDIDEMNGYDTPVKKKKTSILGWLKSKFKKKSSSDDGPKDGEHETIDGKSYERRNGKLELDKSDTATREALKEESEEKEKKNKFYNLFLGGGFLGSIGKLFGLGKDKGEKKTSIFDKIKGVLAGIAGTVGTFIGNIPNTLANLFSGGLTGLSAILKPIETAVTTIGSKIGSVLGGATKAAGGVLNAAGGLGLDVGFVGTLTSLVDSIKNHGSEGIGSVLSHTFDAADEREAKMLGYDRTHYDEGEWQQDYTVARTFKSGVKNGTLISVANKLGNKIVGDTFKGRSLPGITGKIYEGMGNAITGTATAAPGAAKSAVGLAGKAAGKVFGLFKDTKAGKLATSAGNAIGTAAESVGGLPKKIVGLIGKVLEKAGGLIAKVMGKDPAEVTAAMSQLSKSVSEHVRGLLKGPEAKKLAGKALKLLPYATIALAVENGWEDAQSIIGLMNAEDVTPGYRFLSAIASGISEAIFGLLTPEFLVDKLLWVGETLGIDVNELQAKRQEAKDALAENNEAAKNGVEGVKSYNTVREYLKNTKDLYTTQDKIKQTAGKAFDAVKTGAGKVADKAKEFGKSAMNAVKSASAGAAKGLTTIGQHASEGVSKIANSVFKGTKKIGDSIGKYVEPAMKKIKGFLANVNTGMQYIGESVTAIGKVMGNVKKDFDDPEKGLKDIIAEKAIVPESNPLSGVTNAVANGIKIIEVPMLLLGAAGGKVYRSVIKPVVNAIVPTITTAIDGISEEVAGAIEGDPAKVLNANAEKSGDNDNDLGYGLGTVVNGFFKIPLTGIAAVVWGVKQVAGAIGPIVSGIGDGVKGFTSTIGSAFNYIGKGDVEGLTKVINGMDEENNSNVNGIGGTIGSTIPRIIMGALTPIIYPITLVKGALNKLAPLFEDKSQVDLDAMKKDLDKYKDPSTDFGGYDKTVESYADKLDKNGGVGSIGKQIGLRITAFIHKIPTAISRMIKSAFGWFSGGFDSFKNWLMGKDPSEGTTGGGGRSFATTGTSSTSFGNTSTSSNNALNMISGNDMMGGASGVHVRQTGKESYAGSTLAKLGCGPAAAATVLNAYGKSGDLKEEAAYAKNGGYVAGYSGTRAAFFGDVFAANGINSRYVTNSNSIKDAVASGNPTVLLGQDRSNKSKANSPFGPNPHYVVTRGMDRNGNVVVDDSELGTTALYDKSILKNAQLGVATGGASGTSTLPGTSTTYYASNLPATEYANTHTANGAAPANNKEAVWAYFKSKGLSDEATAGIMGNIDYESAHTWDPTITEFAFKSKLNKKNPYSSIGVDPTSSTTLNKSYTAAIDSKKISLDEFEHPYKEYVTRTGDTSYKSSSGSHEWLQYGYGLPQYTSPGLKENLYNNTVAKGKSIGDLVGQLDSLTEQLQSAKVWNTATTANISAADVAREMLYKYERPAHPADSLKDRVTSAVNIYKEYTGKNYDLSNYNSGSTSSGMVETSFPKYDLNDKELTGLANIIQHEQPGYEGRYAEASLMANLVDAAGDDKATKENLIKKAVSGWFYDGKTRYNDAYAGKVQVEESALKAANDVFKYGKRTVPRYVNEHDCFSDIKSISPAGDIKDRSAYKKDETVISNKMGSTYKFYTFPNSQSDPFGYTSDEYKTKWGDGHYTVDANGNITTESLGTMASTDTPANGSSSSETSTFSLSSLISNVFSKVVSTLISTIGGTGGKLLSLIFGSGTTDTSNTMTSQENQQATNGASTFGASTGSANTVVSGQKANGFPYYNQGDSRWGDQMYKYDTYRNSACGPTSMAMVLDSYGSNATPVDAGEYSIAHGHRIKGSGTGWGFFKDIGNANGLTVDEFDPDQSKVTQYLQNKIPVISSQRPGHFTKGGHYIVLSGMDSNGNIYVNDPSSTERTSHAWKASDVFEGGKQYWAVSKNGQGSIGNITPTEPSTVGSRKAGNSGLPLLDLTRHKYHKIGGSSDLYDDLYDYSYEDDEDEDDDENLSRTKYYNTPHYKSDVLKAAKQLLASQGINVNASTTTSSSTIDTSNMDYDEAVLALLTKIAENTSNNTNIPAIVDLLKQLSGVVSTVNNNTTTSTADTSASATVTDTKNNIDQELAKIITRLDAMSTSL